VDGALGAAVPPPEGVVDVAEGVAALLVSPAGDELAAPSVAAPVSVDDPDALLPPSRKSVTYQPLPLSWKPAAVTCLENASAWQDGQTVNSGSDIFRNTSLAKPQAAHL